MPPPAPPRPAAERERRGFALGLLGVLAFSLTLPMTRVAVAELDPGFVAFGRMALAGLLAAALIAVLRLPRPPRAVWPALGWTAAGVVVGFPLCSSLAMVSLPSAQGAVVTGLLPLATSVLAAWRYREHQPPRFWACAALGSALVVGFALRDGAGAHAAGYLWMLVAVALGAAGYAAGGRASTRLGGVAVILWALVLALPLTLPVAAWQAHGLAAPAPAAAWAAFAYVTVVSQVLGFFAWYNGLALGGIARVGQVQLLQVFFTIALAAGLFGEPAPPATWAVAAAVIVTIAIGRGPLRPAPSREDR